MAPLYCLLVFFVHTFSREVYSAIENQSISSTQIIKDPEFILSKNGTFKLGFFSPPNSANRYVGIWFNQVPVQTVVWVANRDKPITDSSGELKISVDGNLQLTMGQETIIWSTNVPNITINNSTAQLQDTGNLVLLQHNSTDVPTTVWQSFEHPTNTFLPGMRPTISNTPNNKKVMFQSWKSPSEPSEGNFSIGIGITGGVPQIFTWNNGTNFWRTGPWDGNNFIGLPNVDSTLKDGFVLEKNDDLGTLDMSFDPEDANFFFNYVVDVNGTIIEQYWDADSKTWTAGWVGPSTPCEVYGTCGAFGSCDHGSASCRCLRGFRPRNDQEWRKGNHSSGCVRRTKLQCNSSTQGSNEDSFLRLQTMKVPDNVVQRSAFSQDGCRSQCVSNCSCLAYAYHLNIGCMIWTEDLIDTQAFSSGGVDLFLRIAASELGKRIILRI